LGDGALDHRGETARDIAEEALARRDQFVRSIIVRPGVRCGGGRFCGGGADCAEAGTDQPISAAASATAARREAKFMNEPLISKSDGLNLTPTSKALSLKPDIPRLDFIGTNYDGTTALTLSIRIHSLRGAIPGI
jgi:hypothetical protein